RSCDADKLQSIRGLAVKFRADSRKHAPLRSRKNFDPCDIFRDPTGTLPFAGGSDSAALQSIRHVTIAVLFFALEREKQHAGRDFAAVVGNSTNLRIDGPVHRADLSV